MMEVDRVPSSSPFEAPEENVSKHSLNFAKNMFVTP